MPDATRFEASYQVVESGCWIWSGSAGPGGYGRFRLGGQKTIAAHRWSWTQKNGQIPQGLVLDHFLYPDSGCVGPSCVNPDHVRPTTNWENVLRGNGPTAVNKGKTHCPDEHEFTPENTYMYKGERRCKLCRRNAERRRRVRRGARSRTL